MKRKNSPKEHKYKPPKIKGLLKDFDNSDSDREYVFRFNWVIYKFGVG